MRSSFRRWRALRELRIIDKQYGKDYKVMFGAEIVSAVEAFDCGDRELALKLWENTRRRFPQQCMASEPGLSLLLHLGCFDEVDKMMDEGRRRYPHDEHYAKGYAQSAHRRGNVQEALLRCEVVRRRFPLCAEGYSIAAACLTDLGRHDEAESIIQYGILRLPNEFELRMQHARIATQRREWPKALQRWEVVRSRFEKEFLGPLGVAQCLREIGRFAEAEEVLTDACTRFYKVEWMYVELANLAAARGKPEDAVGHWEALLKRSPTFAPAYPWGADAMRRIGREAQADELLCLAVRRVRSDLAAHLEYARSAHRRGDWVTATGRWALVRERFPECIEAREQEAEALVAAGRESSP